MSLLTRPRKKKKKDRKQIPCLDKKGINWEKISNTDSGWKDSNKTHNENTR